MLDRNLPFTDNSEGEYILSDYHMKLHYSQTLNLGVHATTTSAISYDILAYFT